MTKLAYTLDSDGYHTGDGMIQESPLEPGRWLIPSGYVEDAPPVAPVGMRARWVNRQWELEKIPPEPVPPEPSKEEKEAQRVAGIKAELDALDRKSIRAIRAINAGLDVRADNVELVELEVQAKALRLSLGN